MIQIVSEQNFEAVFGWHETRNSGSFNFLNAAIATQRVNRRPETCLAQLWKRTVYIGQGLVSYHVIITAVI